jgi:ankyrin repeat protein
MSEARLFQSIKALDVEAVASLLAAHQDLLRVVDDRRRNPLHFLCGLPAEPRTSARSLALARRLLDAGLDVNASAFADNVEAIALLVRSGARVDPVTEDETPFLGTVKWSRFVGAERMLRHGANVNFQNRKGLTALHLVLKKNSDRKHGPGDPEPGRHEPARSRAKPARQDLLHPAVAPAHRSLLSRLSWRTLRG